MIAPRWQVTYPNTWRDNLIIWPLSVPLLVICLGLLALEFLAADMPRRGA